MKQITKGYIRRHTLEIFNALIDDGESFEIVDGRSKRVVALLTPNQPDSDGGVIVVSATQFQKNLPARIGEVQAGNVVKVIYSYGETIGYLSQVRK